MSGKARLLGYIVAPVVVAFGVLVLVAGCQKDKPVTQAQATQAKTQGTVPAKQAAMSMEHDTGGAPAAQVAQAGEQTTCPVMGGPIDKNVFIEYKGKKVYFCCPSCEEKFKADPEKYVSKLPQFAK